VEHKALAEDFPAAGRKARKAGAIFLSGPFLFQGKQMPLKFARLYK